MADKIYCGSAKEIQTQYGPIMKVTLDLDHIYQASKDGHSFTTQQGRKKIKIDITARREPDQYGNTHSVSVDVWKPLPQGGQNQNNQNHNPQENSNAQFMQDRAPAGQQNNQNYTPPSQPVADQYSDDIPF